MAKTSPDFTFEHIYPRPEEAKYASLKEAQAAALPHLAENFVNIIRQLLEQGVLIKVDGRIVPNPEKLEQPKPEPIITDTLAVSRKAHTSHKPYTVTPAIQRFMKKVTVLENGCWFWNGGKDGQGYGQFSIVVDGKNRNVKAHRFSYEFHVGELIDGLQIDHLCFNRACVNPAHLEQVTPLENTRRNSNSTKTHCAQGHEFTPENTRIDKLGHRQCRRCSALKAQKQYERKKGKSAPNTASSGQRVRSAKNSLSTPEALSASEGE